MFFLYIPFIEDNPVKRDSEYHSFSFTIQTFFLLCSFYDSNPKGYTLNERLRKFLPNVLSTCGKRVNKYM